VRLAGARCPGRAHATCESIDCARWTRAELAFAGIARQAELIAAREVSSRELVELCLDRIARHDARLNSFRVVFAERARMEAEQAEARGGAGGERPLLGVPIAVKDDADVAGEVTLFGTAADDRPAQADSEVVRRLRAAGAVILGVTNGPELLLWPFTESAAHGITRNPWDLGRSPGGSAAAAGPRWRRASWARRWAPMGRARSGYQRLLRARRPQAAARSDLARAALDADHGCTGCRCTGRWCAAWRMRQCSSTSPRRWRLLLAAARSAPGTADRAVTAPPAPHPIDDEARRALEDTAARCVRSATPSRSAIHRGCARFHTCPCATCAARATAAGRCPFPSATKSAPGP